MTETTFITEINTLSEQTIQLCYHCHKCTSGCPVAAAMVFGPDRTLRLVQMGERQRILESPDIWLCAGCETCGTRCPNEIDIARVMDALRQVAQAEHAQISEPDAARFHRLFLGVVRTWGRSHEAVLLAGYKIWTLNLLSDLDSGARMLAKGKIPLLPHPVRPLRDIRRLFAAAPALDLCLPETIPQADPDSAPSSARQEAADGLANPEQTASRLAQGLTPPAGEGEDVPDPAGSEGGQ